MTSRCMLGCLVVLFLAGSGRAQDVKYEKYRLENGMTVILHEDHSLPVACINTWYYVGSKDEPSGRSGFAHLFEHLMFMGTKRVPENQFDVIMEAAGGNNNASTGTDRTNYYSFGPSNLLPTLLWLDADRLEDLGKEMTQEKLDAQRGVVRNERRQGSEMRPYGKADLMISRLMYPPGHPHHIDVIGTHEDLQAATLQDVKDFFASYYVPNNASLVVAGDFDPEAIKPLIARLFGTLPRRADPVHAKAEPVALTQAKRVTLTDKVQFGRLTLVYHSPPLFAPGDAAMDLAAAVLTSGKSSRLYKRLVYEDKLATRVSAYQGSSMLGSLFRITVMARQDVSLDEIEKVTDEVLGAFVAEGPTDEELERHKASREYGMLSGLQSILSKADRLNRYNYFLGEPNSFRWDLDRYHKATTTGVRDWARKVLAPDARLIMRVLPESAGKMLAGRDERPTLGPPGKFVPEAPNTFTLSSGIEVLHWRRPELPLVQVALFLRGGSAQLDGDLSGRAFLAAAMLDEGAGDLDALAFSDALNLLGARLSARAGRESTTVGLSTLKRNLDRAMALYADAILRPRFDPKEWDRVKTLHLQGLKQAEDRPTSVASLVGMRAFFGDGHCYGRPVRGTIGQVERIGLDSVKAAHRQFYIPANATFFVAGDLTADEAKVVLEKAFGDWRNPAGSVPVQPVASMKPANRSLRVVVVDKPDSVQTVIRFYMPGPTYSDPARIQFELFNTILGGSFTSRLNQNLREDKHFTYGAGSGFNMSPSTGYVTASSSVQAEVTGAALREFLEEFKRIRMGDITAEEARKTRETNRRSMIQSFQGLRGLIAVATELELHGRPFSSLGDDLSKITAVTEADLNALAADAIPLEQALLVLVGDKKVILEQLEGLELPPPTELTVTGDAKDGG